MSASASIEPGTARRPRSRRLDWILIPAVCLLTLCVMAAVTELLARLFFPVTQIGFQNCFQKPDPTGDKPVNPNSVCWERIAESRVQAQYKYNSLGNRSDTELGPKQPGTYRIVLIGSSMTQGMFVPRENTFAALLPQELSEKTGKKIELYNEALGGKFRGGTYPTQDSPSHFNQVLAAQPDMILWVITPGDVVNAPFKEGADATDASPAANEPASPAPKNLFEKVKSAISRGTVLDRLKYRWEDTRTSIVLKHLLIGAESEGEYIDSYLKNEDYSSFLNTNPPDKWKGQLVYFDAELAALVKQAKAAGVPLVAVLVPNRPLAAIMARGEWPVGYDPYKLENHVREEIQSNGGTFVDILHDYHDIAAPERHYFPVDGHPDSEGHAIIASVMAKELTNGAVPALKPSGAPATAMERAK
jgi:hypothetical protein